MAYQKKKKKKEKKKERDIKWKIFKLGHVWKLKWELPSFSSSPAYWHLELWQRVLLNLKT